MPKQFVSVGSAIEQALKDLDEKREKAAWIYLEETPLNNHGCTGFYVEIKPTSDREGIVMKGVSCSSCWQMGHDNGDSPIAVGTKVRLPEWCGSWDIAKRPFGYSHNELVEDRDDPRPDCTRVCPSDLKKEIEL
jgi:ferredoxin